MIKRIEANKFVVTYSGSIVGVDFGVPTVTDIAVQTMRICRFNGSLDHWWPVGNHLILCGDLAVNLGYPEDELDCLLHDAAEVVYADVPGTIKLAEHRTNEHKLTKRLYQDLGINKPSSETNEIIDMTDQLALFAEAKVIGHPAADHIIDQVRLQQPIGGDTLELACEILTTLWKNHSASECLKEDGIPVTHFRTRLFNLIAKRRKTINGTD